jgi:uncharacterized protein involved in exopolysaccharide biosynthesis
VNAQPAREVVFESTLGFTGGTLVATARRHWVGLLLAVLLGGAAAYGLSLLMKPAWQATTVLMPARDSDREDLLSSLPAGVGNLASLAGVSVGGSRVGAEALEVLRSRALVREFIQREKLQPVLNEAMGEPSTLEKTVDFFEQRVLDISEDKRTRVVELSVTWRDREAAADWVNKYVALANDTMRARAIDESARRRAFIEQYLRTAETVELRQAAWRLVDSQMKTAMIASTRREYAYQVVDPAVAPDPDDWVRPRRSMLAALGGLALFIIAFSFFALRDRRRA